MKFVNFAIARKTVKSAALLFASSSRKIVNFVNFVAEFNPGHNGILEMCYVRTDVILSLPSGVPG